MPIVSFNANILSHCRRTLINSIDSQKITKINNYSSNPPPLNQSMEKYLLTDPIRRLRCLRYTRPTRVCIRVDSAGFRRRNSRGQPSIYFPIGDHVNVSWCCSHTNASGVISTSHIVASHITKLLLSFRQILQFRF